MSSVHLIFVFLTSTFFSYFCIPIVLKVARAKHLYDHPDSGGASALTAHATERKRVHTAPIPRLGGIAILLGFFVSLAIWQLPENMAVIFLCSLAMFITGFVDDLKTLSAKLRLLIQLSAASITVWLSHLSLTKITITSTLSYTLPESLGFFLAVFIIIGAINAINMIDGLDGLAAGGVLIGMSLLSYVYYLNAQDINLLIVFSIPILGALLGFLKYNSHPAVIFMGDGGSNWLGFMSGVFMLLVLNNFALLSENEGSWFLSQRINEFHSLPLLTIISCFAIPVVDTMHVIYIRLRERRSPFSADNNHLHHSLMKIGLTHEQSVTAVYFFMIFFGILGLMPIAFPEYPLEWVPLCGFFLLFFLIGLLPRLNKKFIAKILAARSELGAEKNFGPKIAFLLQNWERLNRITIYTILLSAPFFAGIPSQFTGINAALLFFVLLLTLFFKKNSGFFAALVIIISATVLLAAINSDGLWVEFRGRDYNLHDFYNGIFIWLTVSSILFFIVTFHKRYLLIKPTDFLLVILPFFILIFPVDVQEKYKLGIIAIRSLVLFAALRTFARRDPRFLHKIRFVCLISLAWLVLVSLFGVRIIY